MFCFIDFSLLDEEPFYYTPKARNVDYNVAYTKNTFISASRALSDYLLTTEWVMYLMRLQQVCSKKNVCGSICLSLSMWFEGLYPSMGLSALSGMLLYNEFMLLCHVQCN